MPNFGFEQAPIPSQKPTQERNLHGVIENFDEISTQLYVSKEGFNRALERGDVEYLADYGKLLAGFKNEINLRFSSPSKEVFDVRDEIEERLEKIQEVVEKQTQDRLAA